MSNWKIPEAPCRFSAKRTSFLGFRPIGGSLTKICATNTATTTKVQKAGERKQDICELGQNEGTKKRYSNMFPIGLHISTLVVCLYMYPFVSFRGVLSVLFSPLPGTGGLCQGQGEGIRWDDPKKWEERKVFGYNTYIIYGL